MNVLPIGQFYIVRDIGCGSGWSVALLDSGDKWINRWAVVGTDFYGVTHEVAVREMTEFVNNAIEALRILKEQE